MDYIELTMIRKGVTDITTTDLPPNYSLRHFINGDEQMWAEITTAVGEFESIEKARAQFDEEFGPFINEFKKRSLFLLNEEMEPIGTGTAWYDNNFRQKSYGRVHWVGIHPTYQGRGLGAPLVSAVMNILRERHCRLFLTTQTTSVRAIKIYLGFGFEPLVGSDREMEGWKMIEEKLGQVIF